MFKQPPSVPIVSTVFFPYYYQNKWDALKVAHYHYLLTTVRDLVCLHIKLPFLENKMGLGSGGCRANHPALTTFLIEYSPFLELYVV